MSAPQQGIQLSSPTRKAAYASAAATVMMSSEHRENDRAFPACVTNLHIIATTHHRSVVRARACWRSHRTRSGCALSQRAIDGVAQDEEPGERDGAPGARGAVALSPAFTVRGHRSGAKKKPRLKVGQRRLILISLARPSSMLLLCIFGFSSSGTTRTVGDSG
jgi:hypothetical protein